VGNRKRDAIKKKDGILFSVAQYAFADPLRIIAKNEYHSHTVQAPKCGSSRIVRFTNPHYTSA
jgi:hypothetical protein